MPVAQYQFTIGADIDNKLDLVMLIRLLGYKNTDIVAADKTASLGRA